MARRGRLAVVALGLVLVAARANPALAQEEGGDVSPEGLYKSSQKAFEAKQYGTAMREAQQLLTELARLRVEQLKALLPAAPEGWTADEASGDTQMAFIAGVGVSVKRDYEKGDSRVSVNLVSDSPMVTGFAGMMANPLMLQGNPRMSLVTIQGKKAVLELDKDSKSVKLNVLLNGNTSLLTFEGNRVERADVTETLCRAFDFAAIEKTLQN